LATPAKDSAALSGTFVSSCGYQRSSAQARPGREDEVFLWLVRNRCVGLLDLALQKVDIDLYFNGHNGSLEVDAWMVTQQVGCR
jgi:hypothetical protein